MVFCHSCGKENEDASNFCIYCGINLKSSNKTDNLTREEYEQEVEKPKDHINSKDFNTLSINGNAIGNKKIETKTAHMNNSERELKSMEKRINVGKQLNQRISETNIDKYMVGEEKTGSNPISGENLQKENIDEIIGNIINNKNKLFERNSKDFLGKPFYLDYDVARILVSDKQRHDVDGLQKGSFLLAFYDNDLSKKEVILLRTISPVALPQEKDIFTSTIEYYKDNFEDESISEKMDSLTRYDFSFSGVECNVLGTFYEDESGKVVFGSDIGNYYSATNYTVYKPRGETLELIVNFGLFDENESNKDFMKIGSVKYSSTSSFQSIKSNVLVPASDLIGRRTALFGKTRTGKSNTIKKIIQMVDGVSDKEHPIGQIVFDINGEYANTNQQDEGTSIFDILDGNVERYSVYEKEGFKTLKTNFYENIIEGFKIIKSHLEGENGDYLKSFLSIDLSEPKKEDFENDGEYHSAKIRYDRLKVAYLCCLYKAGFKLHNSEKKYNFEGNKHLNNEINNNIDPKKGITISQAIVWFENVWEHYFEDDYFKEYQKKRGKKWADENLESVLIMLTRKRQPRKSSQRRDVSGFIKLRPINKFHTTERNNYKTDILESLRNGKIVLIDLSQGDEEIQQLYSEELCKYIFNDSISNFINNSENNYIQFYFEEAHNLFPKKDAKDLTQVYNRIAKEGAKLHLGLIYATQEVSSISSNILKNTENWFISHLNNTEELREIKKFDDFEDVADSLKRFSPKDKGFVRMKLISGPYVIPVQIDKFGE